MTDSVDKIIRKTFHELLSVSTDPFDDQLAPFFDLDEELVYQVRVPSGAANPGLFVYVSPKPGARIPDGWVEVLDRHNLVWVGAEDSGNEVHVARRVGFALLAAAAAAQVTTIDASRVVLTGFSGGGRVASMMMPAYPDRFAGAIFICGANPLFTATQDAIDQLADVPMVFLTGTGDFNYEDTRMAIATYEQAGLRGARLMVVDGMEHALPEGSELESALTLIA